MSEVHLQTKTPHAMELMGWVGNITWVTLRLLLNRKTFIGARTVPYECSGHCGICNNCCCLRTQAYQPYRTPGHPPSCRTQCTLLPPGSQVFLAHLRTSCPCIYYALGHTVPCLLIVRVPERLICNAGLRYRTSPGPCSRNIAEHYNLLAYEESLTLTTY